MGTERGRVWSSTVRLIVSRSVMERKTGLKNSLTLQFLAMVRTGFAGFESGGGDEVVPGGENQKCSRICSSQHCFRHCASA